MLGVFAAILAALTPAYTTGARPVAFDGPSGRVLVTGWRYSAQPATGAPATWQAGRFAARPAVVPGVMNPSGYGAPTSIAYRGSVGWYRTVVHSSGGIYRLHFDSASFKADVWVDGHHAGTHLGAYDPFEVTTHLARGPHTVVVRVDSLSPARQSAAGYHRTWFNYGGLDGEVTIRRLAPATIEGATIRTTLVQPDGKGGAHAARVLVSARVLNRGPARRLVVVGRLRRAHSSSFFATRPRTVRRGATATLRARVVVDRPELWSAGHGARYELNMLVPGGGALRARVGLRTIESKGGRILVNGRPTVLRGASLHEDSPLHGDALTPAEMDAEVGRLKAIGATATRAQHPLAPGLLERLDAAGILLWQQIGPVDSPGEWSATTARLQQVATGRVRRAEAALQLHPSIAVWSLGVEVAGNGRPGQGAWVDARARELHRTDPGRLVAVDVWGPHKPAIAGPLYSALDVIGVTSYYGWYEDPFATPGRMAADLRRRIRAYARTFPGRALVLTEFGAEGTPPAQNAAARHGGRGYQARLLGTQLRALRGLPLAGALVWVLDDFAINPAFNGGSVNKTITTLRLTPGLNQKGLFDRRGNPKPAVAAVRNGLAALSP